MGHRKGHEYRHLSLNQSGYRIHRLLWRQFIPGNRLPPTLGRGLESRPARSHCTVGWHEEPLTCVVLSRDGRMAATTSWDAQVRLWDVTHERQLASTGGSLSGFWNASFSPDETRVAAGGATGYIKILDVGSGQEVLTLPGLDQFVAFLPDGD